MEYIIKKTNVTNPKIDSPEWDKAETGFIKQVMWNESYAPLPETSFKLLYSEAGISVLMHTNEKNLKCVSKLTNDPIWEDSCMEFFFKPSNYDKRYLNFEVNPDGIMHIGIGSNRYDRILIDDDRSILDIESDAKDGNWTIKYFIPKEFILKFFEKISPVCRGNFYKCADKDEGKHLGYWAEVETETPDFHVPDFFEKLKFEK